MKDKALHDAAVAAGCQPFWWDGILGPAWHCGCKDSRHACDQQCSMITMESLRREQERRPFIVRAGGQLPASNDHGSAER